MITHAAAPFPSRPRSAKPSGLQQLAEMVGRAMLTAVLYRGAGSCRRAREGDVRSAACAAHDSPLHEPEPHEYRLDGCRRPDLNR